ncbi:hypothetical protein BCR35DRAFT_330169 [Leucosporidium creatinivorum]|uniref:F-box domain-containing protein n=1 Tax=Leucosporidium creatinivorum TaxID=106004 RepID=A0A1Y2FY81_9BASI|nr:hypothetical protein BCR35DRAFT_330169 [Leucosporidium creatinivorum]
MGGKEATLREETNITLPPEIWVEILARCSHFDLKKAKRVCKSFNELIMVLPASTRFSSALSLTDPSTLTTKTGPLLHPVLKQLDLIKDNLRDILLHGKSKDYIVTDLSIGKTELASSPSSSVVWLRGFGEYIGTIINTDDKGVTIGQVLREVVELWNQPSFETSFNDNLDDLLLDSDDDDITITLRRASNIFCATRGITHSTAGPLPRSKVTDVSSCRLSLWALNPLQCTPPNDSGI